MKMKKAKMTEGEYVEKYGVTRDVRLKRLRDKRWINGWRNGWKAAGGFCGACTLDAASDNACDYHIYAPTTSGYDMGYLMGMIRKRGEYRNWRDEQELTDALIDAENEIKSLKEQLQKLEEKAEICDM